MCLSDGTGSHPILSPLSEEEGGIIVHVLPHQAEVGLPSAHGPTWVTLISPESPVEGDDPPVWMARAEVVTRV